ncbi:hypothetical protein D3C83_36900 [compost metagenome]
MAAYVSGSVGDTPTSMPAIALDNRPAASAPIATPMALSSMPCPTMSVKMLRVLAPNVMRTPISAVR